MNKENIILDLTELNFKQKSDFEEGLQTALNNQIGDEVAALLEDYYPNDFNDDWDNEKDKPAFKDGILYFNATSNSEEDKKKLVNALAYVLWSEYSAYTSADELPVGEDQFYQDAREAINKTAEFEYREDVA